MVDYAIGNDMYVILNIHWDGGWLEEHPLFSFQVAVNQKQQAYWTQIANFFRSYDERLLFAGTNEVHADFGTPTSEHITVQQSYNQTFVNAVRATGGNNASRTLVVQTYNTNIWHGLDFFSLPTDSASNRLMVEVHHYDPYDYTLNPNGSCLFWGAPYPTQGACTWAQESYVDDLFARVRTEWIAQGVPVIIGEYGVATRPNLDLASRQYYLEYMNARRGRQRHQDVLLGQRRSPATNGFALFNRSTGAVVDQGALNAVMRGAGVGNPNVNYTLTTTVNGSGTVSRNPPGTTYPGGTFVTLTATAASGFDFAGWTGDAGGATNPITIRILGNTTVTANFIRQGTGGTGTILREYWNAVTGTTITSLTSNANYPNSPTGSEQLTSLEGPTNAGDNYGARIRGYIHPPITGAYTFWLASDDYGELRLSTSDNPASASSDRLRGGLDELARVVQVPLPEVGGHQPDRRSEVLHRGAAQGGDGRGQRGRLVAGPRHRAGGHRRLLPLAVRSPDGDDLRPQRHGAGTGTGTVTSSPSGINCGSTCSATYSSGTSVTLTAAAASGSTFAGWSGACTGTGTCTVSMTAARR